MTNKLGILAFGHGGGVPGLIPGTPVVNAGNTNFALIPNLPKEWQSGMPLVVPPDSNLLKNNPYWLIDCGPETMLHLCGVIGGRDPVAKNLQGIFLTHCHDDHSGGIKSLAYRCKFIEGTKPHLFYQVELRDLIQKQTAELAYMNPLSKEHGLDAFYKVYELDCHDSVNLKEIPPFLEDTDIDFLPFPVNHNAFDGEGQPFPAFGYKITTEGGKVIVFSGDTAEPIDASLIAEADLIIHDVQFYAEKVGNGPQHYVHCPYKELRDAVPPEHRHKVYLTHTAHDLPPEALADGFKLLRGGTLISVG